MNKNIITTAFLSAVILGSSHLALTACADGMPYEPVFESVPITEALSTTAKAETNVQPAVTKVTPIKSAVSTENTDAAANTL